QIVVEQKIATYEEAKKMYSMIIRSAIHNYSSVSEGLDSLNLSFVKNRDQLFFFDSTSNIFISIDQLLNKEDESIIKDLFQGNDGLLGVGLEDHFLANEFTELICSGSFDLLISDDVDDEQLLGRNRNRKGKAKTNTR